MKLRLARLAFSVAISATVLSCGEPTGPDDFAGAARAPAMTVGSSGEVPGFTFLEPIGEKSKGAGTFDPSLSPVVEICRPLGSACALPLVATFTKSGGPGSESIRVNENHYVVNWHTREFPLVAEALYRIQVRVGRSVLGYTDITIVNDARRANRDAGHTVVRGTTLPIRFRIEAGAVPPVGVSRAILISEAAVTESVGPAGGSVVVTSKGIIYTLTIPGGALLETQNITLTPLSDITNLPLSGGLAAGVNFSPEGLVFYKPATLTMRFPEGSNLEQINGFGYSANGAAIYLKLDAKQGTTISLPISHFSGAGAGGASLVDIDALVSSVSVSFPSELYPTVMKQAQVQLSQQICGGEDFVFACGDSEAEMDSFLEAWLDAAEQVLKRWYDDRLKELLTGSTASDGALSRASDEYFGGWRGSIQLVYGAEPPASLEARADEGEGLVAKGYQASLVRARDACSDSTGARQFGKVERLLLEGFDLGEGETLPTDIEDLGSRNSCTSFRSSGLPPQLARDTTDTLQIQVIRRVGTTETVLPWPEQITFRILSTTSGLFCGRIEGGGSFTDGMDPESMLMSVIVSSDPVDDDCAEIAVEITTPYYAPRDDAPPGLFSQPVFGATDTLHIPLGDRGITVAIDPEAALLNPGTTAEFTATVTGTGQTAVTWTVTGGASSIAGNTLTYTAGNTPGSFTVTARSVADPDQTASARIDILAPAVPPGVRILSADGRLDPWAQLDNFAVPTCNDRDVIAPTTIPATLTYSATATCPLLTYTDAQGRTGTAKSDVQLSYTVRTTTGTLTGDLVSIEIDGGSISEATSSGVGAEASGSSRMALCFSVPAGVTYRYRITGTLRISDGVGNALAMLDAARVGYVENTSTLEPVTISLNQSGPLTGGMHCFGAWQVAGGFALPPERPTITPVGRYDNLKLEILP